MNIPFMSSGGEILIHLDNFKVRCKPGERVSGRVELRRSGAVHARAFTIELGCYEFVDVSCGSGKHRRRRTEWNALYSKAFALGGETDYSSCTRAFEFTIPQDTPPSVIQHPGDEQMRGAGVKWRLHAKLDVPWGSDANCMKTIYVD